MYEQVKKRLLLLLKLTEQEKNFKYVDRLFKEKLKSTAESLNTKEN